MNDVETRLRDALAARGEAVTVDAATYAAITGRRARRRTGRWTAAATAGATVAATVGVVLLVRGPAAPGRPANAGRAPATVAMVVDRGLLLAPSGDLTAATRVTGPDLDVFDVAAVGDGRVFYASAHHADTDDCVSSVLRVTAGRDGAPPRVEPVRGLDRVHGHVREVAVTRDGRRLAYLVRSRLPGSTRCGNSGDLRVRTLETGVEYAFADSHAHTNIPFMVGSMRFSPDGLTLALGIEYDLLDTRDVGAVATIVQQIRVQLGDEGFCRVADRTWLPTGELVESLDCTGSPGLRGGVYVVDHAARVARRLVVAAPPGTYYDDVVLDASGEHGFLRTPNSRDTPGAVYRWDRGSEPHAVPAPPGIWFALDW